MKYSYIFFIICLILASIVYHESTHYVIFQEYGCKNISYKILPNIQTLAAVYADCDMNSKDYNSLREAQALNEIVGYNIIPFIILMIIIMAYNEKRTF